MSAAFWIHLILPWIRIQILGSTFGKSGSGSGYSDPPFCNSGSGSSDPHLEKVDPDPVPKQIRIRIRVPIFHIFQKQIHVGQITMLILLPPKFRKGISQITKTFSFTFYSKQFWCYPDPNQCFLKWIRIRIRGKKSKWIRIWIRSGD